jgi:hypothetical protein
MVDPLEMTLRALQAASDNGNVSPDRRWDALRNQGIPVSYKEFAARWDQEGEEGILHQLVDKFDAHGLTLKTTNPEDQPEQGKPGTDDLDKMAKHATNKALGF